MRQNTWCGWNFNSISQRMVICGKRNSTEDVIAVDQTKSETWWREYANVVVGPSQYTTSNIWLSWPKEVKEKQHSISDAFSSLHLCAGGIVRQQDNEPKLTTPKNYLKTKENRGVLIVTWPQPDWIFMEELEDWEGPAWELTVIKGVT